MDTVSTLFRPIATNKFAGVQVESKNVLEQSLSLSENALNHSIITEGFALLELTLRLILESFMPVNLQRIKDFVKRSSSYPYRVSLSDIGMNKHVLWLKSLGSTYLSESINPLYDALQRSIKRFSCVRSTEMQKSTNKSLSHILQCISHLAKLGFVETDENQIHSDQTNIQTDKKSWLSVLLQSLLVIIDEINERRGWLLSETNRIDMMRICFEFTSTITTILRSSFRRDSEIDKNGGDFSSETGQTDWGSWYCRPVNQHDSVLIAKVIQAMMNMIHLEFIRPLFLNPSRSLFADLSAEQLKSSFDLLVCLVDVETGFVDLLCTIRVSLSETQRKVSTDINLEEIDGENMWQPCLWQSQLRKAVIEHVNPALMATRFLFHWICVRFQESGSMSRSKWKDLWAKSQINNDHPLLTPLVPAKQDEDHMWKICQIITEDIAHQCKNIAFGKFYYVNFHFL